MSSAAPPTKVRPLLWILLPVMALFMVALLLGVLLMRASGSHDVLMALDALGDPYDHFADGIQILPDLSLKDPADGPPVAAARDEVLARLLAAMAPGTDNENMLKVRVPVMEAFSRPGDSALLLRHLATSVAWHLSEERGELLATRRTVLDGRWSNSLHGGHRLADLASPPATLPDATFRLLLWPSSAAAAWAWAPITEVAPTGSVQVEIGKEGGPQLRYDSDLLVRANGATLQVYEQSGLQQRVLTPLLLDAVQQELQAVLDSPVARGVGFDAALMPGESVRAGPGSLELENGMQPGIYRVHAWANPGGPGSVFLKAWEITQEIPLSTATLPERSMESIGWSLDPAQVFAYASEITIYEGDWGKPYPARFELWFRPDDGGLERPLVVDSFRIEGWMR